MKKTQIIILAAGQGKRMGVPYPKVLVPILEKPMIHYVLESVNNSGINTKPIIVVGVDNKEIISQSLGDNYEYVIQEKQLGTGHAVLSAEMNVDVDTEQVIVLYGDSPLVSKDTILKLSQTHGEGQNNKITMATTTVPDFLDWRENFYNHFSRVIRDENGNLVRTVEKRDALEYELAILELNPCYFIFDKNWLFENLKTISNNNDQGEYYLTDLAKLATASGFTIQTISIDPKEALGANTIEQKELIEKVLKEKGI